MPDPLRSGALEKILAWLEKAPTEDVPDDLDPPEDETLGPLVKGLNRVAQRLRDLRRHQADATRKLEIHIDSSGKRENELEEALAALRESEERFKGVFEHSMIGLYRTTPNGRILMVNPALVRMLGYDSFEELAERNLEEKGFEPDYPRDAFHRRIKEKGHVTGLESAWAKKDGTVVYVRESAVAVKDEAGKVLFYEGTVEDITLRREAVDALQEAHEELEVRVHKRTAELSMTNEILEAEIAERKQAEEETKKAQVQLLRAQRLEAVGNLAGGIAHDFNNLLVAILGYTELSQMKGPADGPIAGYLQVINESATRASELTKQLLLFSRGQPMDFMPIDLNRAAENIILMLRRVIGEDIAVEADLAPDLWVTRGDRSNLEQVVMNLIVNARDAMPRGGTIRIESRNKELGEEEARDVPEVEPGRFVQLTVHDTGDGIEAELFDRIFEPFFTTKDRGKGTGLGLSVAYGIVKKHGGWIRLDSEPGQGTAFHVFLPASEAATRRKRTTEIILEKILGKGERILLVEDQESVREFAITALDEHGYEVVEATSAEEALAEFAKNGARFDLVFSDVVLPGLDGLELAERLTSIKPGIPILLNSGYTGGKVDPGAIREAGHHFLRKPYTLTDLLRAIKKRLTGADPLSSPGKPPG